MFAWSHQRQRSPERIPEYLPIIQNFTANPVCTALIHITNLSTSVHYVAVRLKDNVSRPPPSAKLDSGRERFKNGVEGEGREMNWYSEPECRSSYLRPCRCCLGHMLPLFRLGGAHVGMRARRERRRGGGWEERRRRKRGGDGGEQSEEGSGGIVLGRAPSIQGEEDF